MTIRHYTSIALVDLSYLFTRNYRGAGVNAPPNAGANRTLDDIKHIADDVDHVIICLDTAPYLRRDKFPQYKAQRETPPPEELAQKRAVIEALRARGYTIARMRGFEADDVIATLARAYGEWCQEVRMIASDKDIAQCITQNVIQYVPSSGARDAERRDHLKCKVKFGVYPKDMPLWQAMVGDPGDNVPGVPKIGEKKATYVISQLTAAGYPITLQGLAEFLATTKRTGSEWTQIVNHWEALRTALELVTLDSNVPLDVEALLVKPEPKLDAEEEMGVEGFEPNATPSGSPPPDDAIEFDAESVNAAMAAARGADPIIGADPNAAEILRERARAREQAATLEAKQPAPVQPPAPSAAQQQIDAAAAEAHARKAAGQVDPTGRATAQGSANDVKEAPKPAAARPAVTEAEFDPISRAPGATQALPPMPPKPAQPPAAPVTAIVKSEESRDYGLVATDLQPLDLKSARTLSVWLHKGGLYTKAFDSPEAIFSVILRGKELGLKATTALASFHVIEGKPSASADLIRGLAKGHPDCEYFYCESSDDTQATWVTRNRRHPAGVVQRYTYTIEDAKQVPSLWRKDRYGGPSMWEKYAKQMLSKTCSSMLARQEWEMAVLGLYCHEEMGNGIIETVGVAA